MLLNILYQDTRDVFFNRGDKPRISKRVIKVKIIFGILQTKKRRFTISRKPLNVRNAIKHERCNADAHANTNNNTTRLLHLHFSFKDKIKKKQDVH